MKFLGKYLISSVTLSLKVGALESETGDKYDTNELCDLK